MNTLEKTQFGILDQTTALRTDLLNTLTDADLAFKIDGNPTLGELCKQMGEVEYSYIQSFKTFTQSWDYRHDDAVMKSIDALKSWYAELDQALKAVLAGLTDEQIKTQMVDRGFIVPIEVQYHIYREALLIFYAKCSVYLGALGKSVAGDWVHWIG